MTLPIDPFLPELRARLDRRGALVVEAEPGAGKTTRLPISLLKRRSPKEVVVLEPRRLAARLSACRVAEELGESVGQTVGFVTRDDRASQPSTALLYVTEGILERRLMSDPLLAGTDLVILDEFHERHLATDVCLAQVQRIRRVRPELQVVVMSATLNGDRLGEHLGADVVRVPGRTFPVDVVHADKIDDRPLESRVASRVHDHVVSGRGGDVLVFVPGARDIRRVMGGLARLGERHNLEVIALHGSQSRALQDRAIARGDRPKVIVATNVAETSITLPGVTCVIDSGLVQRAKSAAGTGLSTLTRAKISKASAIQRAGRAGRTAPGICYRLYTEGDFSVREAFDPPEVLRLDLTATELALHLLDEPLEWFEPPPRRSVEDAHETLRWIGAIEPKGKRTSLTPIGRRLIDLPLHPRLGRCLLEAEERGVLGEMCRLAALIEEVGSPPPGTFHAMDLLDALDGYVELPWLPISAIERSAERLRAFFPKSKVQGISGSARDEAVLRSLLSGFSDRLGRIHGAGAVRELRLARGGSLECASAEVSDLALAITCEERVEQGVGRARVSIVSPVRADWVLDACFDRLTEHEVAVVPSRMSQVEVHRQLKLGELVLDASVTRATDRKTIGDALAKAYLRQELPLAAKEALLELSVRLSLLESGEPTGATLAPTSELIARAAERVDTLEDLMRADLGQLARQGLPEKTRADLERLVPRSVRLPSGREVPIRYAPGVRPTLASRLQDFFGCVKGPTILGGKLPLLLELLAPNHRAVQTTTDLEGFWSRHYPALAKELRRKYPRHAWPDDPLVAEPSSGPTRRPRPNG